MLNLYLKKPPLGEDLKRDHFLWQLIRSSFLLLKLFVKLKWEWCLPEEDLLLQYLINLLLYFLQQDRELPSFLFVLVKSFWDLPFPSILRYQGFKVLKHFFAPLFLMMYSPWKCRLLELKCLLNFCIELDPKWSWRELGQHPFRLLGIRDFLLVDLF